MYSVDQSSLVSAYGSFFGAWPWDHYATLTFARKLSESTCLHHWDDLIDSIGRLTHGRVGWVRADEQRWSGYGSPEIPLHFHALLKYQNVPAPEAVAALWKVKSGDAQVEAYNCGGGAAYYIAKMFPYEDTRYDMGGLEHFAGEDSTHYPLSLTKAEWRYIKQKVRFIDGQRAVPPLSPAGRLCFPSNAPLPGRNTF